MLFYINQNMYNIFLDLIKIKKERNDALINLENMNTLYNNKKKKYNDLEIKFNDLEIKFNDLEDKFNDLQSKLK